MDVARQKNLNLQLRNSQVFCGGFVFLRPDTQNVSPPSSTYATNGSALSMRLLACSSLNMRCKLNGACPDCYAGNGVAQLKLYDVAPRNFKLEGCNLFQQRGHDARSNSPVISLCWVLFELFAGGCYAADMMNRGEPYGNALLPVTVTTHGHWHGLHKGHSLHLDTKQTAHNTPHIRLVQFGVTNCHPWPVARSHTFLLTFAHSHFATKFATTREPCVLWHMGQNRKKCQLVSQSVRQSVNQSVSPSVSQPASQPVNQSINGSIPHSFSQSFNQSAN